LGADPVRRLWHRSTRSAHLSIPIDPDERRGSEHAKLLEHRVVRPGRNEHPSTEVELCHQLRRSTLLSITDKYQLDASRAPGGGELRELWHHAPTWWAVRTNEHEHGFPGHDVAAHGLTIQRLGREFGYRATRRQESRCRAALRLHRPEPADH